jgi:ketosteroid isomerase-like protein
MAEHPNVARCRAIYEILEHGTMDQTRALLAEDVVWTVPGRGKFGGPKHGIEEVFEFFEHVGWEASSATFTIKLRDVVADDGHIVAFVHYHHERPDKIFDQDGIEYLTLDGEGRINGFSAFIRDSAAFDEFFA